MTHTTIDQCDGHPLITDNFCIKNHDPKSLNVHQFFNCMAKNLVKDLAKNVNKYDKEDTKSNVADYAIG